MQSSEPETPFRGFMGLPRPHTLTTRLVGLGTAIVIISLLVLGAAWFTLTRQALQTEVVRRHEELAHRVAEQIAKLMIGTPEVAGRPEIYFTRIWGILRAVDVGEEGAIYLVDETGRILGYAGVEALQGQDVSQLPPVRGFLARQPITEEFVGLKGERAVGAWYALENGWGVIAETPSRRALAEVDRLALIFYASLLGSVALATVLTDLFARRLVRPLLQLQEGAAAIGRGELDQRIEIQTGDEIEDLARQFNQMAAALQTSRAEIEAHARELEQRVADRTRDLQHRAVLLATVAEVGRAAASILELEPLIDRVVDLVRERFDLYYVGLFLLDETGRYAVLKAGTGEAGRLMKEQAYRLTVGGHSMVGTACAQRQARIALDVGEEPTRFDNPLLPKTRSEMALPLVVGERVLGALDVQSAQPAAFSEEDIAILQLVADQVAVAVDNARKFSEEAALLEATSPLYRASRRLTTAMTTDQVAQAILESVAETGADGCVVVEFEFSPAGEPEALLYRGVWRRDREPQFRAGMRVPIAESPFPWEMVHNFWTVADVERDGHLPPSAREVFMATGVKALANIPLRRGERAFGQVVVLRATAGPFSGPAVRLYETLSDQASVALERAHLHELTQQRAEEEATLRAISDRIAQAVDVETVLRSTVEGLSQALAASGVYVELGP